MLSRPMVCRLVLIPGLLASVVAAAFTANPAWARSVGLDVWNASALARQEQEAFERRQELHAVDDEICQRIGVKEAIIADLIDGHTTLAQATARFMALNRANPDYLKAIRETFPGSTDEEKTARNVIDYALGRVDDLGEYDRLSRKFEAELKVLIDGQAITAE